MVPAGAWPVDAAVGAARALARYSGGEGMEAEAVGMVGTQMAVGQTRRHKEARRACVRGRAGSSAEDALVGSRRAEGENSAATVAPPNVSEK